MLGSFGARLGLCFAVRWPKTKTLNFDDLLTRKHVFQVAGGPKNSPKSIPRASWRWNWLQGRLGGLLGSILGPFGGPKTDQKGEGFSAKLWSIDLTGYNERQVKTPTDASDPSWSSLLSN